MTDTTATATDAAAPADVKLTNLLGLPRPAMEAFFESIGEKKFRATQVMKWIHQEGVDSFDEMTNLAKPLRERLKQVAEIRAPGIVYEGESKDGTRKWVLEVSDGSYVETVLIPSENGNRRTLCVSSQVGCSLDCSFCSTGKQGFERDLTAAEIIGQVWVATRGAEDRKDTRKRPVTNVVMMGMGEPLMNYDNVVPAMKLMLDDNAYGLSKRRVTLSTSGVVPKLDQLGDEMDVSLAISLHAANDELRNVLVPINRKWNIRALLDSCHRYLAKCDDARIVTIEYTLIKDVNDQIQHAEELAALLDELPCKINLIPFNPFPHSGYEKPSRNQVMRFQQRLYELGYTAPVRATRGDDIDAACGQLVGQVKDRTRRAERYINAIQLDAD
ncbi:23S rRNA (adenine(2503)-C(2))-methyltransferase RlmN [Cobetia marina]|jgi:23S rRNA (adenine2503-C2)-methyltransferase|uniref:Dual-specificity RNA methyltransferase RlmN n=1 Tax=Cobetia marina TaxID=28258 RepID=A0ABU9GH12_COBMA|nr:MULTISPECIES: 23S rRNA (adenine(2503)-C(2))-methyltransferase RlmN [Cobetia]AOM00420.1 23S rRNA (adenine(2503)-C(2))-methyltransferase [Cobetia marina]AZV30513.1 23S rRNA (adenine(2503)-C(2))-methyltransferase RlmN [Cobetia sp. ICG0124]MDA5565171.1 23S rRNA (adenine(2503)-C(2))-methyltransferase RlmN [Cobetia sp. MMG027]MDH2292887.1 23S rRNA (adenine(2503)-C(2))-methyltransferase RlmN [Cobetia sp. 10Alg 146]MDI6004947.1 23S rRNA (adenine(2503)-C(2))-methyltransferase RlmN [Cobetia pacifica]